MINGRPMIDLSGEKFGRLTVVGQAERRKHLIYWRCKCECGGETEVSGGALRAGRSKSCGCGKRTLGSATGLTGTKVYQNWRTVVYRCTDPKHPMYKDHGARGVKICDRWRTFSNFYDDMGTPRPFEVLARIDSRKGYEPSNCVWVERGCVTRAPEPQEVTA